MPSSYQRIFEYYEVGNRELMHTEIIPFRIPVLYKGSTRNTCNWMNFNIWHEIYIHLDEIVNGYSQKSIKSKIQYVKGVTVIIGYKFECADYPVQMFPMLDSEKNLRSSRKEENVEFKMCSHKLIACIYPLQINCSEIDLPHYYVRNDKILKGLIDKEVKRRILLTKLNQERQNRLNNKSKGIETQSEEISDKYVRSNNESIGKNNSSIFNFNSKILSSTPTSNNSSSDGEFDHKSCKKQISFSEAINPENNIKVDSEKKRKRYSEENDFKTGTSKKKKIRSSKEKKKNFSSRKKNKIEINKSKKIKKKSASKESNKYEKSDGKEKQKKSTRFLRSSCASIFDTEEDTSCDSFNSLTQKTKNTLSNPLKNVKNKLACKHPFSKVIPENTKDEKLDNVKESIDVGIAPCDTLPDLLNGYEEKSWENSNIKNTSNFSEIFSNGSRDKKLDNDKEVNFGVDSYNTLPPYYPNEYEENSQGKEIKNISLEINEKIFDESHFLSLNSEESLEHFPSVKSTCSKLNPFKLKGETSVEKGRVNTLSSTYNFNSDSFTDTLPDLTQSSSTKIVQKTSLPHNSPEFSLSCTKAKIETLVSHIVSTKSTSSKLKPLKSKSETSVRKKLSFDEHRSFEGTSDILSSSHNFISDSLTDSLPDLTQSTSTKILKQSSLPHNSSEFSLSFTKTKRETLLSSDTYVKGRRKQSTKKNLKKVTSKLKSKTNTKGKHVSKEQECNRRKKKSCIDSLNIFSSSQSSVEFKSYSKDDCSIENSASSSIEEKESIALSQNLINSNHEIEHNSDHDCEDTSEDKLVKRVYEDFRKFTIDDFKYHLEKHSPYFKNIILGKIPNERDNKLFQENVPRDMTSELFIYILDDEIVDELMEMCLTSFSSIMKSSGRKIKEVIYNMLVIIPELLKKVLISLPYAKENDIITDSDCEEILSQLPRFITES